MVAKPCAQAGNQYDQQPAKPRCRQIHSDRKDHEYGETNRGQATNEHQGVYQFMHGSDPQALKSRINCQSQLAAHLLAMFGNQRVAARKPQLS